MAEGLNASSSGLRERKKIRTRAVLIDAALQLCLEQGYEATTVEQIAASAEVSPRTFSRYFPTKDAVFLTLLEDYSAEVALELQAVPRDVGPLEAMRRAHVTVLTRIAHHRTTRVSADRIVLMLRVFNASEVLKRAAYDFQHDGTVGALAARMGVDVADRRAQLANTIFSAVIVNACGDLIADTTTVRLGPTVMVDRLNEALQHVAVMASDLQCPPSGADYERVYG